MRVEIAYERRVEVFDTDRFTEAQPFSGRSMLADFTLEYEAAEPTARMFPRHGARRAGGSSWQAPKRPASSRASRWTARRCSRECSAN